jgi:hypothetical protein
VLPFTREQFLNVFADYNTAIWPAQVIAGLLGVAIVAATYRASRAGSRIVLGGLALMWLWTGVLYHGVHFARINPAARVFAIVFIVQAALMVHAAWTGPTAGPRREWDPAFWIGCALAVYAALLYPLIGSMAGHTYPAAPVFGVTPCPVTLFTLGIFLVGAWPVPRHLLVLPGLWSLVGGSAAFLLGIPQDWPLLVGGVVAVALLWRRAPRRAPALAA